MRKKDLKKELERKQAIIDGLKSENAQLRVQLADKTDEANKAMEEKEAERRELCDQIGELQEQAKADAATIARKSTTIKKLIEQNAALIETNKNLSSRFAKYWRKPLKHTEQ